MPLFTFFLAGIKINKIRKDKKLTIELNSYYPIGAIKEI